VLERAGVTADQRVKVQKAQDLLRSLPPDVAPSMKREIVEVAFRAFDISIQDIVRAASAEIAALEDHIARGEEVRRQAVQSGEARVQELEKQIAEVRAQVAAAEAAQAGLAGATRTEIAAVKPVVDFFAQNPPKSEPKAEAKAEPKAEARPEPKAEAKPKAETPKPAPAAEKPAPAGPLKLDGVLDVGMIPASSSDPGEAPKKVDDPLFDLEMPAPLDPRR
jgi:ribosomal protein L29